MQMLNTNINSTISIKRKISGYHLIEQNAE